MTRRQNLHYKISSQQKLKTDNEYVPKSAHIKLDMDVEKGTKEGEAFQDLSENHSQVISECQLKLKSLVIEAGNLDLVEKYNLTIISFMKSVHKISEKNLAFDDRKDIDAHMFLIGVVSLYSDHPDVHLDASKERILEVYKKRYELEEITCARVTCLLAASPVAAPPHAHPAHSENFGERYRRLLNERAAAAASADDTRMAVFKNRLSGAEPPPHPKTFVDAAFYIKLKATFEVIFVSGWGVFIQKYQFKKLNNRMSKLEKVQNLNKSTGETAV